MPRVPFLSQDPRQDPTFIHLVVVCLSPPLVCDGFSDVPRSWWLWQFWGTLVRFYAECPSIWVHLMVFLWLDWDPGFGQWGRPQRWIALCQSIQGTHYQHDLPPVMLTLTAWLRWCLLDFSTVKGFKKSATYWYSLFFLIALYWSL